MYVCIHLCIQILNMVEEKEIVRVSVSEAARLFGVNAQTIRRAVQNKELTYVVVAGRYKLNFESLIKWSQNKTTLKNKSNRYGIGQYVEQWRIKNTLFSPNKPRHSIASPEKPPAPTPPYRPATE